MTSNCNNRVHIILLICSVIVLAVSCTVSYSFSGARVSPLAKTFSVDYFQNRASIVQPTFSQDITDELIDKVKTQTSLKYTTDIGDVSFEGEITEYSNRPLTASSDYQAATNRFTISIKVKFDNSVEPEYSFESSFSRYEDYESSNDFSSVEAELSERIMELLVEDIFNKAFVTW